MKNNEPAFPRTQWTGSDKNAAHRDIPGMTLRDWFAGQALASLITMTDIEIENDHIAKTSYQLADAMLAERDK
jgi:hypothetical protein